MAKKKNLTKRVSEEFSRRVRSEAASQQELYKSSLRGRIESLVPTNLRWLLPFVREFRREQFEEEEVTVGTPIEITDLPKVPQVVEPLYTQYRCRWGNPLTCDRPLETVQQQPEAKYCRDCGFPAVLAEKAEIRGSRGRYRIESFLGHRGMGRLYRATQLSNSQQVVIKEYLLPERYFTPEEVKINQQHFELLAGVNLADGRVQDFRLCHPWEAIADRNEERCYLVTKGNIDLYPTLSDYLALHGPMNAIAVRQVLNQVLQTLEFLHTQKFRLPSGQVQHGIAHGNLSLNSLLIARSQESEVRSKNQAFHNGFSNVAVVESGALHNDFFIYICDMALWESFFNPNAQLRTGQEKWAVLGATEQKTTKKTLDLRSPIPSPARDLVDLGYVGFYLLAGGRSNPIDGKSFNPNDERQWPPVNFTFKAFLLRLMGIEMPFESAQAARQALLKLTPEIPIPSSKVQLVPEEEESVKTPRILWIMLGILGLMGLLGIVIWLARPKPQLSESATDGLSLCCINQVSAIPSGRFAYTAERQGVWNYALHEKNLVTEGKTLEEELQKRQPKLQLIYQPETSNQEAIDNVLSQKTDFALLGLVEELPLTLESQTVGYDGLVAFVAFSYSKRDNSLPTALNGQITFEQLRQLYTGQISNWRELGGPNLPVRLYIPDDTEAVRIFEQRVLKDRQSIQAFRRLQKNGNPQNSFTASWVPEIYKLPTFQMLRQVIQDFERERVGTGAIAFDKLSQVFGQCSVYPLALKEGKKDPVQVLIQDNGQPIDPLTDLCEHKGSYFPNLQVFQDGSYPLGYELAVVYPRDNSRPPAGAKFAEMLRTEEGQQLLNKTGVVPLQPLPTE